MKKSETKQVLYALLALMLCLIFSGVVSAEDVSEDLNSLSSEIDRFLDTNKPVFVFFYADGCYPCQRQKLIMDELEREYADKVAFVRVNGDENTEATNVFSVTDFPAMFLITSKVANSYNYQYFTGFKEKEQLENSLECAALNTGLPEKSSSIQIMSSVSALKDPCHDCFCARRAAAIASSPSYFTEGAFLSMDVCGKSVSK